MYFKLKNGEEIYYEDVGNGPDTLVMSTGWTMSHDTFTKPSKDLKDIARCISYDNRGHYLSKNANSEHVTIETLASDLNELIEGLDLHDITLLGWSMGVSVVLTYVRMYGCERLKQIILCDMTPKNINDDNWHLGLRHGTYTKETVEAEKDKPFFWHYKGFVIEAVPKLKYAPAFLLDPALKKKLKNCDERILNELSVSMNEQDNRDVLPMISVPVSYFYADPGACFMEELAEWYGENVKVPYKAVAFKNADHMFPEYREKEFVAEIRKLLG